MSSSPPDRRRPPLGLRLAIWYAAIFVASSLALIALTYVLLSTSLRQYDREIIESTLVRYATAYGGGGVDGLVGGHPSAIRPAAAYEPLFVRVVGPFQDRRLHQPADRMAALRPLAAADAGAGRADLGHARRTERG